MCWQAPMSPGLPVSSEIAFSPRDGWMPGGMARGTRNGVLRAIPKSEAWGAVPRAGLTAVLGLAGAGCGGNAGLTDGLIAGLTDGLIAGGCGNNAAAGLGAGWAGGFAPVPVAAKAARGLAVALADAGLATALADAGLAGGCAAAVCSGWVFSAAGASWSPRNCSSSLPAMATRITFIQIGRAALAPVSFSPK